MRFRLLPHVIVDYVSYELRQTLPVKRDVVSFSKHVRVCVCDLDHHPKHSFSHPDSDRVRRRPSPRACVGPCAAIINPNAPVSLEKLTPLLSQSNRRSIFV